MCMYTYIYIIYIYIHIIYIFVQITAVKNYEGKKTATTSKLIIAVYASYFYVGISCTR